MALTLLALTSRPASRASSRVLQHQETRQDRTNSGATSALESYVDNKARLMPKMGYLTVLHVRLGAKFGDLHAKDSSLFCKRLIGYGFGRA
jgi:hypothetical protein